MAWSNCPDCDTNKGSRHVPPCDLAYCKEHGMQFLICVGDGPHTPTIFKGDFVGTQEAIDRGWYAILKEGEGYISCHPSTPGAMPDLNKVHSELLWDANSESYI